MKDYHKEIRRLLRLIPTDFGGGCTVGKALYLADLIVDNDLKTTVDIGVYKGRSLVPQCVAHAKTQGIVYGVDPYSKVEAHQVAHINTDAFSNSLDFEKIYQGVLNFLAKHNLKGTLLRQTSESAHGYFVDNKITLDMVHVDGNHSYDKVKQDVALYMELIRDGGFIVMDDISWPSIRPHYERLKKRCSLVREEADWAVVRK